MSIGKESIKIEPAAKRFMERMGINEATFNVALYNIKSPVGYVKEIEGAYESPADARHHKYYYVDGYHIYISRDVRIFSPLTITLEGFWKFKCLALNGAGVPI